MQTLDLNLATRPFRNNTLPWLGYGVALALVAAFTLWNVQTYRRYHVLLGDLQADVSAIDQQFADLNRRDIAAQRDVKSYDIKALRAQAARANEVIHWKAFSWSRLFDLLEELQPHNVRMTAVHPVFRSEADAVSARPEDQARGVPVSLEGLARDVEAFLELERQLLLDPHFDRLEPERTGVSTTTGETIFSLRVFYDPDPPPATLPAATAATAAAPAAGPETVSPPGLVAEGAAEER